MLYECRDLTVPLHLERVAIRFEDGSLHQLVLWVDDLVRPYLESAREEGWEPIEPIDLVSLYLLGRVACRRHWWDPRARHEGMDVRSYESITIPLRRRLR